jgi:hypothetical protein
MEFLTDTARGNFFECGSDVLNGPAAGDFLSLPKEMLRDQDVDFAASLSLRDEIEKDS